MRQNKTTDKNQKGGKPRQAEGRGLMEIWKYMGIDVERTKRKQETGEINSSQKKGESRQEQEG